MTKTDKAHLNISVLTKMISQITAVKTTVEQQISENALLAAPVVSTASLQKALRDITAQYDALTFARDECVRVYGEPAITIEHNAQGRTANENFGPGYDK